MPSRAPTRSANATGEGQRPDRASILSGSFVGTFKTRVSQLRHTSSARELRPGGIRQLVDSITECGWLADSVPVVTLLDNAQEHVLNADNLMDIPLRCVDGNHRVAALRSIDEDRGMDRVITVSLYTRLEGSVERVFAERKPGNRNG